MAYRKLQDLPFQSLPREKLLRQGRHSLSNAELLAIFLRMGIKGKNVLDMSSDLIQSAGSLDALAHMEAAEIADICKGIGMAKAATLSAAFELGARALRETLARQPIQTPEDVYDYLVTAMRWKDKETVLVLLLDTKSRLIKPVEISSGTLNESIAHPRDILRPAVIHNAYGFVLAHNHPSGNPAPSRPDDLLTERVRECAKLLGVRFLDHVIIGKPTETDRRNYYSYNHPNGDRLREADKGLPLYH